MRHPFAAALGGVALLLPAAAAAQAPDLNRQDIRCLVATAMIAGQNESMAPFMAVAGSYYIGRMEGRSPGFDIEAAMVREVQTFKPEDVAAEGKRCGTDMQAMGERMKAIGERLKALGGQAPA